MSKAKFFLILRIILILLIILGVWFNYHYYPFLYFKKLSLGRLMIAILIQVAWFGGALLLIFGKNLVYRRRKEILLFFIVLLICLGLLEIGLRVFCPQRPLYSPHPYLNYYGTPNYRSSDGLNRHNSFGFRGPEITTPKPKGVFRIFLLGASSTYTIKVKDWHKDFARQLEEDLRKRYHYQKIEVVNAGIPGWTSWETLINFQFRILELEPDLIIVYHGASDLHARLVDPQHYRADNTGSRKQWQKVSFLSPFNLRLIQDLVQLPEKTFDIKAPTSGMTENSGYSRILKMTPSETLEKNPPIYFARNLRNLITLAKKEQVSVLLATWAYSDQFPDYIPTPHCQLGLKEHRELVKKVGLSEKVPVYDFASQMPKSKEFWSEGRHLNEKGSQLKGRLFGRYIFRNRIINREVLKLKNEKK
jgi:hypothetical protein